MDSNAILEHGAKIRELQGEQARIAQKNELLLREQEALLNSNSDIRKRLLEGKEDVTDVEKRHLVSVEVLEERSVGLLDEILERQERLKELLKEGEIAEERLATLVRQVTSKESEITDLTKKCEDVVSTGNTERQKVESKLKESREALERVTEELTTAQDENLLVQEDTKERIKKCEKEERLISVRRNDLEIYERRLRKQYPDAVMNFTT